MDGGHSRAFSRRAGLAVALASIALVRPQSGSAAAIQQRGMAGGGLVILEQGATAHVSLLATQSTFPDQRQVVVGSILWVEANAELTLASVDVTAYDPQSAQEGHVSRIQGTMSANGAGTFPFVLDVLDAGPPGSGTDQIALWVGADAVSAVDGTKRAEDDASAQAETRGFSYRAAGLLAIGDIQHVELDIPID